MSKGRPPKNNRNRQRAKNHKNENLSPTANQNDNTNKEIPYQDAPTSIVENEKSGFDKFYCFLEKWGAVSALVVVMISGISWAIGLDFDVSKAKDDISENQKNIEKVRIKTNLAALKAVSMEKDIEYIKDNSKRVDADVKALSMSVSEIKHMKKPAVLGGKSPNR